MNKTRKSVLITGASGGIGQALAKTFYQAGYDVCLHYHRSFEKIQKLLQDLEQIPFKEERPKAVCFSLDLTKKYQGEALIEQSKILLGKGVDVLIHNAGQAELSLLQDLTHERFDALQHLFLENPLFACQKQLPSFLEKGGGRVIFISSIWGICGASCEIAYSSLKSAQHGLVKALAQEWAPSAITVNAIACGVIDTEMNAQLSLAEKESLQQQIPMGRLGKPEEIASLALYLACTEAEYLTGQIISPNGAFYC